MIGTCIAIVFVMWTVRLIAYALKNQPKKKVEYEQIDWNDGKDLTKSPHWKGENWRNS